MNITCPVNSLSYGITGLNLLIELDKKTKVAWWPIGQAEAPTALHPLLSKLQANTAEFDFRAPSVRLWHQFELAHHVGWGLHVGFPIFELDSFTARERAHLLSQDRLLVCSEWARSVVEQNLPARAGSTFVVPLGVDREVFFPLPFPKGTFTFLHVGKWEVRKGQVEIVKAFERAFGESDDVSLVFASHNPLTDRAYNQSFVDYCNTSRLAGKITVLDGRFGSHGEVAQLMSRAHVGVFPSKAEGFCLPALEMMSMGRHIIATNYSGLMEFCNEETAHLVEPGPLEVAHDGKWFHGQGRWASLGDFQIEEIADHMVGLFKAYKGGALSLNQAGMNRAQELSWENSACKLLRSTSES